LQKNWQKIGKKLAKNWQKMAKNGKKLCKNFITTLVFEKNDNFFAENSRKLQKIMTTEVITMIFKNIFI
jgi:hypothetical protein